MLNQEKRQGKGTPKQRGFGSLAKWLGYMKGGKTFMESFHGNLLPNSKVKEILGYGADMKGKCSSKLEQSKVETMGLVGKRGECTSKGEKLQELHHIQVVHG